MATCYKCGGEIEFYHNGFNAVPIHLSGSCSGSAGSTGYRGRANMANWVERENQYGERFIFTWVEYPSYVNPNAKCPVCGASVYFYQSPYGGRVFFDDLGPPWPKHPCTSSDDSSVQRIVREFDFEQFLPETDSQEKSQSENPESKSESSLLILKSKIPEWSKAGWCPLLLSKAESNGGGIVIEGTRLSEDSKDQKHTFVQIDIQDTFREICNELTFLYSMTMNSNRLNSALIGNVVFLRQISENIYEFSTISVTLDNKVTQFLFQMRVRE